MSYDGDLGRISLGAHTASNRRCLLTGLSAIQSLVGC
jgi:hypothetical protein